MPNAEELLDILLKNRGITLDQKERFLNPSYEEHLYDPFLMKNMERVCVRIFEAVEAKEKIVVYSDYDCDGIPAAVIMHDFFTKIGYTNFYIYIPDRHDEGYGLHMDAIEEFIKTDVKLIITFDLGITAIAEVAEAQANGVDVIVTDHHLPHEHVPQAYAILNPKQIGCEYPDKMLCGAGIAFKLVQALVAKYGEYFNISSGWEKWLLDMAGIATLADQVPLLDENRVLAYYGLKVLQKNRRPGLQELWRKMDIKTENLVEEDVTFMLAPRLNAASRMDSPMRSFEVLSEMDPIKARVLAEHLEKINKERKSNVAQIMKEVKHALTDREDKTIIVIGNPKWRVGVLGLVASKIVEEYKRPTFVWGSEGSEVIRGSCRSIGGVNLVELMTGLPEGSLIEFGGHVGAGGFSVAHDEVHFLEERLISVHSELKIENTETEEQEIDATITLDDVTEKNFKVVEMLAPYGMANPKPTFLFKNVKIAEVKEFGKEKNHLEIVFQSEKRKLVKSIAFFKTRESYNRPLSAGESVDLVATFEKSFFAGRTTLRLRIVDIQ